MALRNRQISGYALTKEQGFMVTLGGVLCIPILSYGFWFPLFGIAEELRIWIVSLGVGLYVYNCSGNVPTGVERAQLFFGSYTGVSFPAGVYFLPKIPFPIISLLLVVFFKKEVSDYLGWVLEGEVGVESITTSFESEGLTQDGVRVVLKGRLVLEVENAAVFLSQKGNYSGNRSSLISILSDETSSRIKQRVIANHTAKQLYQGSHETDIINNWITEACTFIESFGLRLARSPIVSVRIESDAVRKAFDAHQASGILNESTQELARSYKQFCKNLPKGTSEEVAFAMFNAWRIDNGLNPIDINVFKFK